MLLASRTNGESIEDLTAGWIDVYVLHATEGGALDKEQLDREDWSIEFWAELALTPEELPPPFDRPAFWQKSLARIERFIERHGHSRIPDGYHDEDGPLDILVGNIRWHPRGKGGRQPRAIPGHGLRHRPGSATRMGVVGHRLPSAPCMSSSSVPGSSAPGAPVGSSVGERPSPWSINTGLATPSRAPATSRA